SWRREIENTGAPVAVAQYCEAVEDVLRHLVVASTHDDVEQAALKRVGVDDQVVRAERRLDASRKRIQVGIGDPFAIEREVANGCSGCSCINAKTYPERNSSRARAAGAASDDRCPFSYEIYWLGDRSTAPSASADPNRVTEIRVIDGELNCREVLRHTKC